MVCDVAVARFPELPVLHIADCTAAAVARRGFRRIGLLGTEPTMRDNYLKDQLKKHGLEIIVPTDDGILSKVSQQRQKCMR